jgi:curved DNA-binding protein
MEYKDYYKILGVPRDAAQDAVKRAYRKLARKYHPDVSKEPDAEERFKEVQEAYEVLKDPEKRAAYDRLGSQWRAGQEFRPPPGWDTGFEFRGGGFTDADAARFSDFFESLFGRGFGRARGDVRMRGEDRRARITVSLDDAYHGAVRTITLQSAEIDGEGHVTTHTHNLKVKIPRGIVEGQQIRLAGQGGRGIGGASAGDLYLDIGFEPHAVFRAEGRDIHVDLPITPWEAALGAKIPVPTLGGTVEVAVPAGSQSGRKLRLRGRGLPGAPAGDQYVVLRIVTPPPASEKDRELYRRMAEQMPYNPRARMGGER